MTINRVLSYFKDRSSLLWGGGGGGGRESTVGLSINSIRCMRYTFIFLSFLQRETTSMTVRFLGQS